MQVYLSVILILIFLWFMWSIVQIAPQDAEVFALPSAGTRVRRPRDAWVALLAGMALIAEGSLRWRVGVDYDTYSAAYPFYRDEPISSYRFLNEPGIRFLAKLAARVDDDYVAMFALASIVTIGLCIWTIYRDSEHVPLSLMLFVLVGPWQSTFNGVRQWLACAIIFWGHRYIIERRLGRYVLVVATATLFHISAMALIFAYFIPRRRLGLARAVLLLLAVAVAAQSYDLVAHAAGALRGDLGDVASSAYFKQQVNPLRVVSACGPAALYVAFTNRQQLTPRSQFYANLTLVHAAVMVTAINSAYVARFATYSSIFLVLALPALINSRERLWRSLLVLIALALYSVTWYFDTTYSVYTSTFRWVFDR